MSFQFTLQKILEVKENDKLKAEKDFTEATKQFEEVATKLYEVLKKKEQFEVDYRSKVENGIHIFQIQQAQFTIEQLQKQIDKLQYYTQQARSNMNKKENIALEKSIELKKYEKVKQLKYEQYVLKVKRQENILMDEISVQQFMNREIR